MAFAGMRAVDYCLALLQHGRAWMLAATLGIVLCVVPAMCLLVRPEMPSEELARGIWKADQPISARLEVLGEQFPGSRATLSLTATTDVPADDVELLLDIPKALAADEISSWRGSLGKGEQASLQVDVTIPDGAQYEVRGAAVARFPHAKAVAVDEVMINAARTPRRGPLVRLNSRGEPIIEFPAKTKVRHR